MAVRELRRAPGMLPMFARAGASLIPGASLLPFVAGGGNQIPDLELVRNGIAVDRERVAAYSRVCGFGVRDTLPSTYPHVLAFPLQLALMTDGSFPFPAIGLVHIANTITQHRPIGLDETVALRVWATPAEPHPRGRQFALVSEVRVGDELVWEERSTNLSRGGGASGGGASGGAEARVPSAATVPASAAWRLPGDFGRRYAAVSGDLNPIHLHPLSARLFGFPSAIAHGMGTKARCLAALEPRLTERFTVEVSFRKPILLPASVEFAEQDVEGGVRFGVRDAAKGTSHLDGRAGDG